jgi:hypothetical protein
MRFCFQWRIKPKNQNRLKFYEVLTRPENKKTTNFYSHLIRTETQKAL